MSIVTEGSRTAKRHKGKHAAPLARSKALARHDKSSAREPGDLQFALVGDEPTGPSRQACVRNPRMDGLEKSDGSVVPKKPANKAQAAEPVEGRGPANGNATQGNPLGAQPPENSGATRLRWLRAKIGRDKQQGNKERLTNLFSLVRVDLMREVYYRLRKHAAPGVDGQDWAEYGDDLGPQLEALEQCLRRGAYIPPPVRRVYIPKPGGKLRPLGIPTVEDKVVQGAVVAILTPVYEAEFLDCSYGYRPGRSQRDALAAVDRMLYRGRVNWVLEIDVQAYFDSIDHGRLIEVLGYRIGDTRMLRHIVRWLKAGVLEDGKLRATEEGTPQGGSISALLANIYLHYALDVWFAEQVNALAGAAHMVRYADDVVMGFQYKHEAEVMRQAIAERLASFGLTLHPDKTRLIRFGKFAQKDCHQDGLRRPETFCFLGFRHISGRSPKGHFCLIRRTEHRRMASKLTALRAEMRRRRHVKIKDQWTWLCSVLRGHYGYYGVPTNYQPMETFRHRVRLDWHHQLQRRSQRATMTRRRLDALDKRFPLPTPTIQHLQFQLPYPAP